MQWWGSVRALDRGHQCRRLILRKFNTYISCLFFLLIQALLFLEKVVGFRQFTKSFPALGTRRVQVWW